MTPEAVLFDCDGTLVDSETLTAEVYCALLRELGHAPEPEAILQGCRGRQLAAFLADLEAQFGALPGDFVATFRARLAPVLRARLREIEGAGALLAGMTHPVCVASNALRSKIELCLEATGLARFFGGRIFSAYEVGAFKPAPGLFLHAAQAMGAAPARCLVVEDSEPGVAAGLAAGMRVVALAPEGRPAWLPDGVPAIGKLAELPRFL
jgi:HAD superfamily hydrolase (TIGR01509 family)